MLPSAFVLQVRLTDTVLVFAGEEPQGLSAVTETVAEVDVAVLKLIHTLVVP